PDATSAATSRLSSSLPKASATACAIASASAAAAGLMATFPSCARMTLPACVVGREGGHVDDVGILRAERTDLHRERKADENGADGRRAAQFAQHFRRDRRGMESG